MAWAIGLLLLGFFFLVLEFFVPSSGLLGILATVCILASLVAGYRVGTWAFSLILMCVIVGVPSTLAAAVKYWPDTPIGRMMVIRRPEQDEVLPESLTSGTQKQLIGKRGKAKSTMLPSGSVEIQGRAYDAVSDGMAINAGQPVIVIGLDMQVLIVRPDDGPVPAELADASQQDPLNRAMADPFEEANG